MAPKAAKGACLLRWFKSGCLSPGAGACAQQCAGFQALELIFVGQAALEAAPVALEALALMPSRMLGSISLGSLRRDRRPALCAALRGPSSEALRLAQAVALEAVEALEALALMLRSTLGLISMAHGAGALLSSAQDCQAQDSSLRSARFEATPGQVPNWVESQLRRRTDERRNFGTNSASSPQLWVSSSPYRCLAAGCVPRPSCLPLHPSGLSNIDTE